MKPCMPQKYEMKFRLYFSDVKPKMAIFVSKLSHCLLDLLARYTAEWNVEIPLIVVDVPDLQHVAERFGIPFYLFPITKENKMEQEKQKWSYWKNITSISLYWHAICK